MADQDTSLPTLDISALPGPDTIHRQELPNGIIVMTRENFASPSVVISGHVHAGALFEPEEKAGLANLTASALMRGTQRRSFNEIYETIEGIGANLGVGGGTHFASFRGKSLADDLNTLLDLLSDVLREPEFPQAPVEQLKGEKLTTLAMRDQNTRSVAAMTFEELAYGDHPYRQASDGYRETVSDLTRDDLADFHARRYGPRGLVIAVVGAVQSEAAVDAVEAALGDWKGPEVDPLSEVSDAPGPDRVVRKDVAMTGKTQADIVLGAPGPRRSHPHYLAAALGNSVLGRFGLMGRIGDVVREQAGLAYYAYSSLGGGLGPGPWRVIAGVNPANVEQAVELCRSEIRRFSTEKVEPQELQDVQANFIGSLPLQLESNEGVARGLVHIERHDLGLDYYQRFPELIANVTRDELLETAAEHLDADRLAVAVAGPDSAEG